MRSRKFRMHYQGISEKRVMMPWRKSIMINYELSLSVKFLKAIVFKHMAHCEVWRVCTVPCAVTV